MRFIGIKTGSMDSFIRKALKEKTWYPFGQYQEPTAENGWKWRMPKQRYEGRAAIEHEDGAIDKVYQTLAENPKESLEITVNCIVGMNGSGKSSLLDILYRIINNFSYRLIDEAWMLLPYPEAVDFLNKMARRARKRNVSLAIISQRFQDFYEKPEAQAVLTSSDTKLFLAQDKAEIQYLKEVFKLSEGEASFLVTCQKGEGLLKVGADTAILKIIPTRKEFEFVETNLNKLAQRKQD